MSLVRMQRIGANISLFLIIYSMLGWVEANLTSSIDATPNYIGGPCRGIMRSS